MVPQAPFGDLAAANTASAAWRAEVNGAVHSEICAVPAHPHVQALTGDTLTATWSGIEIEWEHLPRAVGSPGTRAGLAAAAVLAHLAVLGGGHDDGEDAGPGPAPPADAPACPVLRSDRRITTRTRDDDRHVAN
jgi:hypothetical protein